MLGFGFIGVSAVVSYIATLLLTRALRWQDVNSVIRAVRNKIA